jgi:hypothetical protein
LCKRSQSSFVATLVRETSCFAYAFFAPNENIEEPVTVDLLFVSVGCSSAAPLRAVVSHEIIYELLNFREMCDFMFIREHTDERQSSF